MPVCVACVCRVLRLQAVMSAFAVRPITNFNELTYHYLRAIFEHLHLTRGGAAATGGQQVCV